MGTAFAARQAAPFPLTIMSASKSSLQAQANKLRRELATHEAKADIARVKLAQIEAKLGGPAAPPTGLDLLWNAAPEKARQRSSKEACRIAFKLIPAADRPKLEEMLSAMKLWTRCDEWKKDGGQYVPKLDRWIKERRWECAPADKEAPSRARQAPLKPAAPVAADEVITDRSTIRQMLGLRPTAPNAQAMASADTQTPKENGQS